MMSKRGDFSAMSLSFTHNTLCFCLEVALRLSLNTRYKLHDLIVALPGPFI